MRDLEGLLRRRLGRADLLRLGAAAAGSGILAACGDDGSAEPVAAAEPPPPPPTEKVAATTTAVPEPTPPPEPARPPLEEEPGDLLVFDWAGYEVKPLWRQYRRKFPDEKPKFAFLTSDDQALGKVGGGYRPDLVHPCVGYV